MPRMTDSPMDVPPEVLADAEAKTQVIADRIRREWRIRSGDSPADVPPEALAEAERLARLVLDRRRAEQALPSRRLTASEAEAIEGPPYGAT